ncbi:hypothetical protein D3879_09015 [Pseudomonas cavernicola]|uniref:Uncharacterized protein n=1 Tax=Pseudomonas cavernicola TaxID=2320866 RepID=A0A418XLP0_9PSED|nr:hypothetical protein D3879_09015 [Pseudomonas cavernicola]
MIQLLKNSWLSLSSQPRRAFYSSLTSCQAVISTKFQIFLINFNHLRFRSSQASRQREANSTAFQTAVNHLIQPLSILQQTDNTAQPPPCQPGAFYTASLLCNPSFKANFLLSKKFSERSAPEVVRIIGPANQPSSTY